MPKPYDIDITDEHWNKYEQKYGKLIKTIASKISGDLMLADREENCSDLRVAAIQSMYSYARKEGLTKVEDFLESKGFDAYTKTVLWNVKGKKGVRLTKRMDFRNKHTQIYSSVNDGEREEILIQDASSCGFASDVASEFFDSLRNCGEDAELLASSLMDGTAQTTADGKLIKGSIPGMTYIKACKAIGTLKKEFTNDQ